MQLPQLIYGSTCHGRLRGYQLLGRSAGVSEASSREFCRWAPSHDSLQRQSLDASSLNFFSVGDNRWAIARSVYGGPEYSGRGGLQVITIALLVDREQFGSYQCHPVWLALTALSLGHLMLPKATPVALPPVSLPRVPFPSGLVSNESAENSIDEIARFSAQGKRTYVLCNHDPIGVLNDVYSRLPVPSRLTTSFATGLKPSVHRDVQLQFILDANDVTLSKLKREPQACIRAL